MLGWTALFLMLPTLQSRSCTVEALGGSYWLIVLASFRFPVLQVFSGLPDYPAVVSAMVILKHKSYYHLHDEGCLLYAITVIVRVRLFIYGEYKFSVFGG